MSDETTFQNVIDLGDEWLVKLFVPKAMLRSISGRKIKGVFEKTPGRFAPEFDVETDGWLDKHFGVFVPKSEGIYNLTAWGVDGSADSITPESMCVQVTGDGEAAVITKLTYKAMLAFYGVDVTQPAPRAASAERTTMAIALEDAGVVETAVAAANA